MNTSEIVPRVALSNRTNAPLTDVSVPTSLFLKRQVSTECTGNKKRLRVVKPPHNHQTCSGAGLAVNEKRNCTTFHKLRIAQMGSRRDVYGASISSKPILASFVSSYKSDVYKLQSQDDSIAPGLPFACAFTSDAKRGGIPLLAVATQDGTVELLNVGKRREWEFEPQRTTIHVHGNAVLDTKWRIDDQYLGTSSGDATTRITCVTTQKSIAVLERHTSSVKSLDWNPSHIELLSTAGRDGNICIWDLRTNQSKTTGHSSALGPVVVIPHAHCDVRPREKATKSRSTVKTVTSVLYLPQNSQQLISGGSFDGVLKQWDLRYPTTGRARDPVLFCQSYSDPTLANGSRGRGLSSLALGRNHSSGRIWGMASDSCIHTYTLPLSAPSSASTCNMLSHPDLFVNTFYVKLALSPCGSWLASGSSGGGVYLWDVSSQSTGQPKAVELKSAGQEISAVDWASNSLAACCDDGTVRIWRPNQEISFTCKTNPEENIWKWGWATQN